MNYNDVRFYSEYGCIKNKKGFLKNFWQWALPKYKHDLITNYKEITSNIRSVVYVVLNDNLGLLSVTALMRGTKLSNKEVWLTFPLETVYVT